MPEQLSTGWLKKIVRKHSGEPPFVSPSCPSETELGLYGYWHLSFSAFILDVMHSPLSLRGQASGSTATHLLRSCQAVPRVLAESKLPMRPLLIGDPQPGGLAAVHAGLGPADNPLASDPSPLPALHS